jgi:hypothetical protein
MRSTVRLRAAASIFAPSDAIHQRARTSPMKSCRGMLAALCLDTRLRMPCHIVGSRGAPADALVGDSFCSHSSAPLAPSGQIPNYINQIQVWHVPLHGAVTAHVSGCISCRFNCSWQGSRAAGPLRARSPEVHPRLQSHGSPPVPTK